MIGADESQFVMGFSKFHTLTSRNTFLQLRGEGVRVSLAAMIQISIQLRISSDGFNSAVFVQLIKFKIFGQKSELHT